MRQYIAVIVAVCLLISSCSISKVKQINPNINVVLPNPKFEIASDPIKLYYAPRVDTADLNCLAKGIYYEASGESSKGKEAVGLVIIHRTKSTKYPSTVCGVITDNIIVKGKKFCQFSWYCQNSKKLYAPIDNDAYKECEKIARQILDGRLDDWLPGAVSFHLSKLNSKWLNNGMVKIAVVGNHSFYKPLSS